MKYREFIRILTDNDFDLKRQRGSHRIYEGIVSGKRRVVTVACTSENEDILPKNFASMIRQSGLGKKLFR